MYTDIASAVLQKPYYSNKLKVFYSAEGIWSSFHYNAFSVLPLFLISYLFLHNPSLSFWVYQLYTAFPYHYLALPFYIVDTEHTDIIGGGGEAAPLQNELLIYIYNKLPN